MSHLPNMIYKMLGYENLKWKAIKIIDRLFSFEEAINIILKNECFMRNLPWMIEEMLDNERLRDRSVEVMRKLFSTKENIDAFFKNENFTDWLPDTIQLMLYNEDLKEKTIDIVNKLLAGDAVNEQLKLKLNDLIHEQKPDAKKITPSKAKHGSLFGSNSLFGMNGIVHIHEREGITPIVGVKQFKRSRNAL